MKKEIIEYRDGTIELFAYALRADENKKLREELERDFDVEFEYVDSDSFRCTIVDADYNDLKKLEELGWSF